MFSRTLVFNIVCRRSFDKQKSSILKTGARGKGCKNILCVRYFFTSLRIIGINRLEQKTFQQTNLDVDQRRDLAVIQLLCRSRLCFRPTRALGSACGRPGGRLPARSLPLRVHVVAYGDDCCDLCAIVAGRLLFWFPRGRCPHADPHQKRKHVVQLVVVYLGRRASYRAQVSQRRGRKKQSLRHRRGAPS